MFFGHGRNAAGTGNYEYAIEMYLQGLNQDPDNKDAHQELRNIALKRKVSGGKSLGMLEAMKLKRPSKDDKQNMLAFEKLLAFDPGNTCMIGDLFGSGGVFVQMFDSSETLDTAPKGPASGQYGSAIQDGGQHQPAAPGPVVLRLQLLWKRADQRPGDWRERVCPRLREDVL